MHQSLSISLPLAFVGMVAVGACTSHDPAVITQSIRRGDEFLSKKQYGEAIAAYRAVVERIPDDGSVRMKLANAYYFAGNGEQWSTESVRAADLLPGDIDAQILASRALIADSRFVDAVDRLAAALHDHPDSVDALILWGNATARQYNSTWSLSSLADVVRDKDKFDAARRDLRPWVSPSDDAAAESAFRKALALAPGLVEAQVALVNVLWASGRLDEGEELLRQVADHDPAHPLANYALGQLSLSRHRETDAERYLRRAAEAGDLGRSARFALVDYYLAAKRDSDARSVLGSMTVTDDTSGELAVRLAADDVRSGKPAEAVRRLDTLLARSPHNVPALLLKAQVLLAMGNPDLRYARAAVAEAPGSSEARSTLGQALTASGDLEDAVEQYVEALRLNPSAKQPTLALARLSLTLERGPEALQYARDAVRLDPDDRGATLALVKALILTQDYSMADLALKPLQSRSLDVPEVLVQMGTIEAARGSASAARTAFMHALDLDPDSLDALSGLISLDLKEKLTGATRQRVEAAIAAHPRDPGYLLLAARLYSAAHDPARTEATLRRAVEIDRTNERAVLLLADLLASNHRPDEARRSLEQLIERRPRAVAAQTSLGTLLEQTGHTREAREHTRRSWPGIRARQRRPRTGSPRCMSSKGTISMLHSASRWPPSSNCPTTQPSAMSLGGSTRKRSDGRRAATSSGRSARCSGRRDVSLPSRFRLPARGRPHTRSRRARTCSTD